MVTFTLIREMQTELIYYYYPEGDTSKEPGVIVIEKESYAVTIKKLADGDWESEIPVEELNLLANAINEMKRANGNTDFVELANTAQHIAYYGDHAVKEIRKQLLKGDIPKSGELFWY